MTYRIEDTRSQPDDSELVLARSEKSGPRTLRIIGRCFVGLAMAGVACIWIKLGLWHSRPEILFPILLGLMLLILCLGIYFVKIRRFEWPEKMRMSKKRKALIFSSTSPFSKEYVVPYSALLGVCMLRKRVRSTIGSSNVRLDLYRVAIVFKNLSFLPLLELKPIQSRKPVPTEYKKSLRKIKDVWRPGKGTEKGTPTQESIPPTRFFFDNSTKFREVFWRSKPHFQELWLFWMPIIVMTTVNWVQIQSDLRAELYWSVTLVSLTLAVYLGNRIVRSCFTEHRLRITQNGLEVQMTGFLGRKRLQISRNWIGDFRPHFPDFGGSGAIDIIERTMSELQRERFLTSSMDEEAIVEDLHIIELPYPFGKRRRIPTSDLDLSELIFLADWLNHNLFVMDERLGAKSEELP